MPGPEDLLSIIKGMKDRLDRLERPNSHTASTIINAPAGSIAATNVQAAIDELGVEKAAAAQEAWIAPTLLNSWVNYGGGEAPAYYCKDGLGWVHVVGLVKNGTIGLSFFTLPVGYRPPYLRRFAGVSNDAFAYLYVTTAGNVIAYSGSSVWVGLDVISFRAA